MNPPEPSFSVNVDVTNPGQFFACCGLLELAHRLRGRSPPQSSTSHVPPRAVEGWFEDGQFHVACTGTQPVSLEALLDSVTTCDVETVPSSDPKIAPIRLGSPIDLQLDWWLRADGTPNLFKTWAANATSRQMLLKWRDPLRNNLSSCTARPEELLTISERQQGSYGFDSALGWDALNVGFSLNEHAGLKELPTCPAVELLGAIGLQRFFPIYKHSEQLVEYYTWRVPLTAPVARVAAAGQAAVSTMFGLRTKFVYRGTFKGLDSATVIRGESHE